MNHNFKLLENVAHWSLQVYEDLGKKEGFLYILVLAGIATVVSGILLFVIDPNIHSLLDGVWSAWVTMTHVGFGDVVPTSFIGRLLAAAIILVGFILFSLFTATLSVTVLGKSIGAIGSGQALEEQARILSELARLHERLESLEQRIADQADATAREK